MQHIMWASSSEASRPKPIIVVGGSVYLLRPCVLFVVNVVRVLRRRTLKQTETVQRDLLQSE